MLTKQERHWLYLMMHMIATDPQLKEEDFGYSISVCYHGFCYMLHTAFQIDCYSGRVFEKQLPELWEQRPEHISVDRNGPWTHSWGTRIKMLEKAIELSV